MSRLYRFDKIASAVPSLAALTDEHIDAYHRDGFLAVEGVLTPGEVESAKAALADLLYFRVPHAERIVQPEPAIKDAWPSYTPDEKAAATRKLFRFIEFEPRLKALALEHPAVQAILTRLLGGEAPVLIQDMALLKPPHIGTEKPWHQDMAYFTWGPPEKIIGVWIALDAATAENGCMHVLPGTHTEGARPHFHLRDCQLADEAVEVERDVLVPLAPGGALFFSSLLHHGTPPNQSPNRRWALQYHYRAASATPVTRDEHAALFFDGDLYAGCLGG
jgi:phytanoyl-CoA hydroxylase